MRWDVPKTRKEKHDAKYEWHSWFAWHPVRIGDKRCVFEVVERRKEVTTKVVLRDCHLVREVTTVYAYRFPAVANHTDDGV